MIQIPAGTYYLGDPCYAFTEWSWSALLDQSEYFADHVAKLDGKTVVAFPTVYGDGTFLCQSLGDIYVDSGMIGLVPVELAEKVPVHMHRIAFIQNVSAGRDGTKLIFGDFVIDTGLEELED